MCGGVSARNLASPTPNFPCAVTLRTGVHQVLRGKPGEQMPSPQDLGSAEILVGLILSWGTIRKLGFDAFLDQTGWARDTPGSCCSRKH